METHIFILVLLGIMAGTFIAGFCLGLFYANDQEDEPTEDEKDLPNCNCEDSALCDKYCIAKYRFTKHHGFE